MLGTVQDSLNNCLAESCQRDSIDRGGLVSIAPTGFTNGQQGLFVDRGPHVVKPVAISVDTDVFLSSYRRSRCEREDCCLFELRMWEQGVDHAPLCGRGWVVQERALAVRTIRFGSEQFFWKCARKSATEVCPEDFAYATRSLHLKLSLSQLIKICLCYKSFFAVALFAPPLCLRNRTPHLPLPYTRLSRRRSAVIAPSPMLVCVYLPDVDKLSLTTTLHILHLHASPFASSFTTDFLSFKTCYTSSSSFTTAIDYTKDVWNQDRYY